MKAALLALVIPLSQPAKAPPRFDIKVTAKGFDPASVTVPAHTPLALVFTRKTDATCTKSIVIPLDDGTKIERELPLDKPVEIDVTFPKAGTLGYACGMNMAKGTIVIQ
jgi:plastocyanin domain-containing protein